MRDPLPGAVGVSKLCVYDTVTPDGLPDGRYCLRTTADPADRLRESNQTNNDRSTLVRIIGRDVTALDPVGARIARRATHAPMWP